MPDPLALRPFWRLAAFAALIAIGGQMLFATVGQLCRYEAFLTSAGAFVVVASIAGVCIGRAPVSYAPLAAYGLTCCIFLSRAKDSFGNEKTLPARASLTLLR